MNRSLPSTALCASLLVGSFAALLPAPAAAAPSIVPAASAEPTGAIPDQGDDDYRVLAGLVERELWDLAVRDGEAFLRKHGAHPKRDLARYRLATALFELERTREAVPHFQDLAARQGFAYRNECRFRLGQCLLAEDRPGEARPVLRQVVDSDADYLVDHARFLLADCAFQGDDFAAAEAAYARVLEDGGPQGDYAADASSGLAWCAWRTDRVDVAVQRIEQHLGRYDRQGNDPYADELRVLLGEAYLRLDQPKKALAAYRKVREGAQTEAALLGAGYALGEQGDHAGAAREFGALLQRFPKSRFAGEATLHRGIHLHKAGRSDEALAALGARTFDGSAEALYWRAQAQDAAGAPEDALATLERALSLRPGADLEARIQTARGDLLLRTGREEEALDAYGEADPDYALHAASVAALNRGDARAAAAKAEELLRRFPESTYAERTRLVLGESLFALDQHARAEEVLSPLARSGEADVALRARSRIAWCRYLGGEHGEAASLFGALAREDEEAAYMEGRALEEAGDTRGATRAWRGYLERFPEGPNRDRVLAGLARNEDLAGARSRIETLLAEDPDSERLPDALFELAERASREGALDVAVPAYEVLIERFPTHTHAPAARYGLGWCLVQEGRAAEAARHLEALRAEFGAPAGLRASAMELLVWAWRNAGDAGRAADAWRGFAALCDDDARLYQSAKTACLALEEDGRVGDALTLLDELLGRVRDPDVAVDVLVEGAYLALDAGEVDRAEAQVRVARRRAPGHAAVAEASFFVGEARFDAGQHQNAVDLYRGASAEGSPVADLALYKQGFTQLRLEDLAGAEGTLTRVVRDHRGSELWGEAAFLLGETRFRLGSHAEAAAILEELRRERPRHAVLPKALFRLGLSYVELERWHEADQVLTRLAKDHPDFENLAEAELGRGTALVALGRGRPARQALARTLALDDGVLAARARIQLGRLARAEGDLDEALSEFLKVAVLYAADEEVAEALYLAGACLEEQDEAERAIERYREVVEDHPETSHAAPAKARIRELERGA